MAMVAGVVVGACMDESAAVFAPLGTLFIQLIKMLVVPLVAISIVVGAASLGSSRSAGKIGIVSIAYIALTTLLSVIIAIVAALIFEPGAGLGADGIASIMSHASTESASSRDNLVGGLGISGGTGEEDDDIAQYALSVFEECCK